MIFSEEEAEEIQKKFEKRRRQRIKPSKVAEEILGPVLEDKRKVEKKLSQVGDSLWDLHTKVIVKKKIIEGEDITPEEDPKEEEKAKNYKFPGGLCEYSSSGEDDDKEDEESSDESSSSDGETGGVIKIGAPKPEDKAGEVKEVETKTEESPSEVKDDQ